MPLRSPTQQERLGRLTRLVQQEHPPSRLVLEVEAIVRGVRREDGPEEARAWLMEMRDGFAAAAEEAARAAGEAAAAGWAVRRRIDNAVACYRAISRAFHEALELATV